uniref:Uncharacterized protein n=1 Tax=Panagrolaimus sp. ES5 TaxID=591445 RepID=A0AC34F9B9_9BILA
MFFGNILYFFAGIIPFQKKYVILVARFITGFGSSNVSLLKAYATSASTGADRSKAIAYVTGGLALGMLTGPGLQLFFTPLGPRGIKLANNLFLNIYTAPAIMACSINIFGALLIYFFFIARTIGIADKKKIKETGIALPPFDTVAIFVCYVTRFCQMFIVTNLES